jgi:hypothetical protein
MPGTSLSAKVSLQEWDRQAQESLSKSARLTNTTIEFRRFYAQIGNLNR